MIVADPNDPLTIRSTAQWVGCENLRSEMTSSTVPPLKRAWTFHPVREPEKGRSAQRPDRTPVRPKIEASRSALQMALIAFILAMLRDGADIA